MKPIEELDISPWPWKAETFEQFYTSYVMTMQGKQLAKFMGKRFGKENAHLIAAAPELYGELWKVCFGHSTTINCSKCEGDKLGNCSECTLGGARAALAKAAGERGAQ